MACSELATVAAAVPAGAWAVGVSGGPDSVSLLALLRGRVGLRLHVVHLDHQARGQESEADAAFVAELARRWGLPLTLATRAQIEQRHPELLGQAANRSAYFRSLRLALFRDAVAEYGLQGVLLGHHADDQAETILMRLLRGVGLAGLCGMRQRATIGGMVILRPLLSIRRDALRDYLRSIGQDWREDSSNRSNRYMRNRVRRTLGVVSGQWSVASGTDNLKVELRTSPQSPVRPHPNPLPQAGEGTDGGESKIQNPKSKISSGPQSPVGGERTEDESALTGAILELGLAARAWRRFLAGAAPELPERFAVSALRSLPRVLAEESIRGWLVARGARPRDLSAHVVARLIEMAEDAASAARREFPGGVTVRRRAGVIFMDKAAGTT